MMGGYGKLAQACDRPALVCGRWVQAYDRQVQVCGTLALVYGRQALEHMLVLEDGMVFLLGNVEFPHM